jgi:flagellar hook-length control protein FliK
MTLPKYYAPGDTLKLVFLAREPRLTFGLSEAPLASSGAQLSSASRMVASVLPRPGEAAMPASVANAAPLLAAGPDEGTALSAKLQGALTQSGLFYESHQAEWVAGRRELSVLLREPQARLATPAQQPQAQQSTSTLEAQSPAISTAAAKDLTSSAASARSDPAMPQQLQALVQQQLAALETGRLVFQLQVWPDQWMRWEIDEDAQNASAPTGDGDALQRFQTRLHLELPKLGELDATLTFDAAGVRVRLDAAKPASADVLQDNRASLRAALADAGIPSADIAVSRHGAA